MTRFRRAAGGRIDRGRILTFSFDGRSYLGCEGDSLASALLANGVHLVGRSFKYHRPRGIYTAGSEEPNALIQLEEDARTTPNLRATQIKLYDGLRAHSQNRWPSLRFDLGAVNSLFSGLFPAAFYYKTFKWPSSFWESLYEKLIRRMAGLGQAPAKPDPDSYDKLYAHCDVLVVGSGPAGLAAAHAAMEAGQRVILADEHWEFGGDLLSCPGEGSEAWRANVLAALAENENVTLLSQSTVWGYFDHNYLSIAQRLDGPVAQRLWRVRAGHVVIATGAIERPLVFADNDRPGIMLLSAARTYVHCFGVLPGRRAVIFTNNDSAYEAADALAAAGMEIAAILDTRSERGDSARPVLAGHVITGVKGHQRVRGVTVHRLTADGDGTEGEGRHIACDVVLHSGGFNPTVHLFSQARGTVRYDAGVTSFVPDRLLPGQRCTTIGAAAGFFDREACIAQGRALFDETAPFTPTPTAERVDPLWVVPRPGHAKRFVDFQNDVTAADIELAYREGYRAVEHLKRYTTMGMATDQGKTSNVNALAIMANLRGIPIGQEGTTTFRPPYTPVTLGAFAGIEKDDLFDPVRRTPLHRWHEDRGARFELVGQWWRPWYYPRGTETMHEAVQRETKAARTGIGIIDASTLGKIDIQGPDAALFLDRIYTNSWSKLAPGRCRYGFMLGEDGMVMDDGVTSRIGENHFHMTTTTGNAARVMSWLEEWLQCEWTDLRVHCTSVTEQWAVIGVSGPFARALLDGLLDIDLAEKAFPFMSWRDGSIAGVPVRVFRISFTGELSYEINCPPSYAMHLWQILIQAGEQYQITPYGTEAMHVLRAEKGFVIVGQETDGTTTPTDLGHDWIIAKQKPDFIGKRSLARSGMQSPDRKQLVGLLTEDPLIVLPEGGQIVAAQGRPPVPMIGHVTSSYFSPNVGRSIALALVKGGRSRMGEWVEIPIDGAVIRARVAAPKFLDEAMA
ncbi:MAG TPA: sarcosine oxidase subunit alpha family protein [Dongiaceae bacterium]|nr:sarcosine oxidase subunit alpha family protein [Dongiaceae bacterium]